MFEENTYRIRQLNDIKVQHEAQTINSLQKCLTESVENTNKMTNLLNNFENRLTALHDLIMPVYDATNTLQIKYSNINKTVNRLDNIIEYYNSVKNLSLVIQAGPGKEINNYISHLNRLKSAIEYFEANKNQSQKKQNEDLWMQGKLNVDREFDQFLNKFTENTIALVEKDLEFDYNNPTAESLNLKENDVTQMISIIDWFKQVEPTHLDKLYEKLIRVRSQLILETLKKIIDKGNSLNTPNIKINSNQLGAGNTSINSSQISQMNTSTMKRNSSIIPSHSSSNLLNTSVDDKKSTMRSRLTENLLSSAGDLRRKKSGPINANELSGANNQNRAQSFFIAEQDFETTECVKFLKSLKKTLKFFFIENIFIGKIIDPKEKVINSKILERIFDPVLRFLKTEAERLAGNMKQITSKFTSKYVIAMFDVLCEMVRMKPEFLKVFEQATLITKTSRNISNSIEHFLDIFTIVERACAQTLKDIIEEIKNDPQTIQPNGNIHPITTETITFIKNLLPFDIIAGFIANVVVSENQNQMLPSEVEINLRRESSRANEPKFAQIAYQVSNETEKKNYRIALAEYFYKLFRWLNLNLKNKAENYEDQNLKWIFLLNNAYKISKLFNNTGNNFNQKQIVGKCETLNELFILAGKRDLKGFYDSEILNFKREYSKCWSRLLSFIKDLNESNPFTESKLRDKERQILKDRFSGFNKEFEEIYEAQKNYYIPSEQAELAEILRQDNTVYIISQYKRFYDTYSRLNFATNREKYIRYAPEDLTAKIREFFSAY